MNWCKDKLIYSVFLLSLNAQLDPSVEIYMKVPKEFQTPAMQAMEDLNVKVEKATYGLPSAGFDFARYTSEKIVNDLGYTKVAGVPSMYTKIVDTEFIVLGLYVDDLYMTGRLKTFRSEKNEEKF